MTDDIGIVPSRNTEGVPGRAAPVIGLDLEGAASLKQRDSLCSKNRLQIGAHDLFHAADLGIMKECAAIGPVVPFTIGTECLNGDVETYFISILEAICDCLLWRINADGNSVNVGHLNASAVSWA